MATIKNNSSETELVNGGAKNSTFFVKAKHFLYFAPDSEAYEAGGELINDGEESADIEELAKWVSQKYYLADYTSGDVTERGVAMDHGALNVQLLLLTSTGSRPCAKKLLSFITLFLNLA